MKIKRSTGEQAFDIFNTIFMVFMIFITLYPVLYVVFAALSNPLSFTLHEGLLFYPIDFSFVSLKAVLDNPNIAIGYKNTIIIVITGVSLNIFLTIMGAYFLSRKGIMWRGPITLMIIFTMYFSGGLIPSYFIVRTLGLRDTLGALILPTAISTYNLIIMRTAFAAIPESLEESAKLDGASAFTILIRIMTPLAAPTIAVLVLYYGVSHWNSWFNASLYMNEQTKYPLQLFLRQIIIQNSVLDMTSAEDAAESAFMSETVKYATIIVATIPILCVYPFLQKYFAKGVMVGAVKG